MAQRIYRRRWVFFALLATLTCASLQTARAGSVSFRHDVMAVLSRAGCNQGTCHGNFNGKNGFRLSLRGEDPAFDFQALTRDTLARRTDPQHPENSLILLKPTTAVPHEGGQRFRRDSLEYKILFRWIAAGLPADSSTLPIVSRLDVNPRQRVIVDPEHAMPLQVWATFSDGNRRDVTNLATYESSNGVASISPGGVVERQKNGETTVLVRYLNKRVAVKLAFIPNRPTISVQQLAQAWGGKVPAASDYIDFPVAEKLRALRMQPSELSSESAFLRRVYLDVLGVIPTVSEARAFLADNRPDKRSRLIDALLKRPEFADHWAQKWADLLHIEEKVLDRKGVQVFYEWIRQSIAEDRPLNEFARDLIAARGSTYSQPAANFYRALRDPETRAETVAQVFLGVRLQCAHCHNHPYDRWTQEDYYDLAAFFPRIQYRILENKRRDKLDKHEFAGEQVVWMDREGETKNPRTGAIMPPKFLGAAAPSLGPDTDRLQVLADWIAAPDNPFFATTQVNRIWYHLLGQGIVDPVDDFRASNPPANEPLLANLSRDFAAHGFRLRHLVRTIMNSRTYQLAARPNDTNRDDSANFSHANIRPLQAEQLLDAVAQVTGVPVKFNGYPLGTRAGRLPGVRALNERGTKPSDGEKFLKMFGKPDRLLACECERSGDSTINQAFTMLTGELLNAMIAEPDNRLGKLMSTQKSNAEMLEELYLAALSRKPRPDESAGALAYVAKAKDRRKAFEDLLWALLNAKEFLLRP